MVTKSLKPISQEKTTLSIRWLMMLILLLMCLSASGLIFNHWQSATQNARLHVENIQKVQNQRVLDVIENKLQFVSGSIATVIQILDAEPSILSNENLLKRMLRTLAINAPDLATLSIADGDNNYFSMFRPEGSKELMYARAKQDGVMLSGALELWEKNKASLEVNTGFYASQRPWFTEALRNNGTNWSPVYTYHSSGSSAIGASKVIDSSQEKKVVVAADYLLTDLGLILNQISDQKTGVLLLLDHQKNFIADSVVGDEQQSKLLDAVIDDKRQLMLWLDDESSISRQVGDLLMSKQLINQKGANRFWLINAISETQMLIAVNQQSQKLIWVSMVIILLAVLLFNLMAKLLIKPVVQLEAVSDQIAHGQWDGEVPVSHIKEINNLSVAYQIMAQEIKTTFNNLEEQVNKRTLRLQKLNNQLQQSNLTDSLTQIPNRRFFNQQMDAAFKSDQQLFLAIIDIDYFKKFNDKYGHLAGDEALKVISKVINQMTDNSTAKVARIGGEEFAALYIGKDSKAVISQLKNMQNKINNQLINIPISVEESYESLSVSIGVSARKVGEYDWNEIYARADQALYQAKAEGRNCLVYNSIQKS